MGLSLQDWKRFDEREKGSSDLSLWAVKTRTCYNIKNVITCLMCTFYVDRCTVNMYI
jgi:uncharacterized Fe-S cluster-containing MiaB family protein